VKNGRCCGNDMKISRKMAVWVVVGVLVVWAGLWLHRWVTEKPVVTVDYLAKFNEIRKPDGYDPKEDGAELYLQACESIRGVDMPMLRNDKNSVVWVGDMNEPDVQKVRQLLANHAESFRLAEDALSKKYCWVRCTATDGSMLNMSPGGLSELKPLCEGLIWRGEIRALDGYASGGLRDMMTAVRLGSVSCDKHPSMVEWVMGSAVLRWGSSAVTNVVAHCRVDDRELAEVSRQISCLSQNYMSPATAMESERLVFYDFVQRSFTDDGHGDGRLVGEFMGLNSPLELNGDIADMWSQIRSRMWSASDSPFKFEGRRATVARWENGFGAWVHLASAELWQVTVDANDPLKQLSREAGENAVVFVLKPPVQSILQISASCGAQVSGTIGVIAILRYKLEKGTLPDNWQQVVKACYLKEAPMDRFSGKPLVYAKSADDFTVYGVGEDGKDDGGTDRKKDIVIWPVAGK
jgi:hypothetical protein